MKEKYVHIDVLFGQVQPEQVLWGILQRDETSRNEFSVGKQVYGQAVDYRVDSTQIAEACYLHAARSLPINTRRTEDEIMQRYRDLRDRFLKRQPVGGIFTLLDEYCKDVLRFQNVEPLCRQEQILEWRDRTLSLGQNLFTCAGLAARDVRDDCVSRSFSWPATIRTDNFDLRRMLKQGISENHFHLNGSTRMFMLCWSYLMNHPNRAKEYFKNREFRENLHPSISYGALDNQQQWHQWIYDAAWIRAKLFKRLYSQMQHEKVDFRKFRMFHWDFNRMNQLRGEIQALRFHAARLPMRSKHYCLDYAITEEVARNNPGENRLLAGERSFLYQCFYRCFSNKRSFSKEEKDLFYLYLLIQIRFRRELIQCNEQKGFRNFTRYENRKAVVWGDQNEYWEESYRLSAAAALCRCEEEKPILQSLEMRIMPKNHPAELIRTIRDTDLAIENALQDSRKLRTGEKGPSKTTLFFGQEEASILRQISKEARHFYVLHFAKTPLSLVEGKEPGAIRCQPRNIETRQDVAIKAKATAMALQSDSYLCSRIRGIDACNHEIGCRPETFATAFRFLRKLYPVSTYRTEARYWPQLGFTYHVGEDFLDISDGLRAIDEAMCFLNLERGDRLGHALALGTEASQYYQIKSQCIYLPAQDLLDNLVWLLFRSLEWGVTVPIELRSQMSERASQLMRQIYGNGYVQTLSGISGNQSVIQELTLQDYFFSWRLRGDDPEIYRHTLDQTRDLYSRLNQMLTEKVALEKAYTYAMIDDRLWDYAERTNLKVDERLGKGNAGIPSQLEMGLRDQWKVRRLLYGYHFGARERAAGQVIERFEVGPEYVRLIDCMQNCMMRMIMQKGIVIECNPSSNKLIGAFDFYEKHPIFRFNHVGLPSSVYPDQGAALLVCVNTDDQGVFDTSLENEFSLLCGCLQLRKDEHGNPLIDSDSVREYLNHLRCMGNNCVFPKAVVRFQRRLYSEEER